MNLLFYSIFEAFMLVTALCLDAFVASLAYGTNKIKIPFLSTAVISVICTGITALSLFIGYLVRSCIKPGAATFLSFFILLLLGLIKLFDSSLKAYIRKHKTLNRKISFSFSDLRFILTVYADPEKADSDKSCKLSPMEAATLAMALSLDGLGVGFGAAISNVNIGAVIVFSLLLNAFAVYAGGAVGNKIAEKISLDLSWLSGVLLIILALLKFS